MRRGVTSCVLATPRLAPVRPDPASIGSGLTGANLGVASTQLVTPRRMQFSLRYDF